MAGNRAVTIRCSVDDKYVLVPTWVRSLEGFRRWFNDDGFPENAQITFLKGDVWVDMSEDQTFFHRQVQMEHARVLADLGRSMHGCYGGGAFIFNKKADVSCAPDGSFVSLQSLRQKRVRMTVGKTRGYVDLAGSPDMVLEVVSVSSVEKDTIILRQAYAEAGIREYWLVDVREEKLRFDILRLSPSGYVTPRKRGGWQRSDVFKRWFRLTATEGSDGFPEFTLEVREE